MNEIVGLNEQDLNRIVRACVNRTFNESDTDFYGGMGTNNAKSQIKYCEENLGTIDWIMYSLDAAK